MYFSIDNFLIIFMGENTKVFAWENSCYIFFQGLEHIPDFHIICNIQLASMSVELYLHCQFKPRLDEDLLEIGMSTVLFMISPPGGSLASLLHNIT